MRATVQRVKGAFHLARRVPKRRGHSGQLPVRAAGSGTVEVIIGGLCNRDDRDGRCLPPFTDSLVVRILAGTRGLVPQESTTSLTRSHGLTKVHVMANAASPFAECRHVSISPTSYSVESRCIVTFCAFGLRCGYGGSAPT